MFVGGITRTKHLAIEAIIENKILVLYKHTSKIFADGF
jgi:hypothetical protein